MPIKFELTITTEHGSCVSEMYANSEGQLADNMPDAVTSYEAKPIGEDAGKALVEDQELWLDLQQMVGHIEYASMLDDAEIERLHAEQHRALGGLTIVANKLTRNE